MTKVSCLVGAGVPVTFIKREVANMLFLLIFSIYAGSDKKRVTRMKQTVSGTRTVLLIRGPFTN